MNELSLNPGHSKSLMEAWQSSRIRLCFPSRVDWWKQLAQADSVSLHWKLPPEDWTQTDCTAYDCPSYVQTKFANPILYAIDNIEHYGISLYIYTTIDAIFFILFLNFLVIFIFYSNCFGSILRHSS